jgi:hypothetical protein
VVCDGLKGLPEAIGQAWPQAVTQTCVIHYADLGIRPTLPVTPLVAAAAWSATTPARGSRRLNSQSC